MKLNLKLNITLFFLGLFGILSLLVGKLPVVLPPEVTERYSENFIKFLLVLNPTIYLILAVVLGAILARQVNLKAPVISGILEGKVKSEVFIQQLKWGIPLGIVSGLILVLIEYITTPYLPESFIEKASEITLSPLTRFLYGGITEEVMVRWGIMSMFVFLLWKIFNRKNQTVKPVFYWMGIVCAALLFGAGHLPIAMSLAGDAINNTLIAYIVLANSIFGIIAGWLFWKHGLESAIIAHIFAHVVMLTFA